MTRNEERILKVIVLVAWIAVIIVFAIKVLNKANINGETIEVEAAEIEEVLPTETPVACTATPIIGRPVYVKSISFECVEDTEDETLYPTRDEVYCLARTVHGEASICSTEVKASVAWVILNRVDADNYPDTIREVCEQEGQFAGWLRETDTEPTEEERSMCYTIIKAWKNFDDRYRTIPSDYLYFRGNGITNYFTTFFTKSLSEAKRNAWDYRMPNLWKGEE